MSIVGLFAQVLEQLPVVKQRCLRTAIQDNSVLVKVETIVNPTINGWDDVSQVSTDPRPLVSNSAWGGTCSLHGFALLAFCLYLRDHVDALSDCSRSGRLTCQCEDITAILGSVINNLLHGCGVRALLSPVPLLITLEAFPPKTRFFCRDFQRLTWLTSPPAFCQTSLLRVLSSGLTQRIPP